MPTPEPSTHTPVWMDTGMPRCAPLARDAECDVCVVGGGIAGLLTAERLSRHGLRVVLLERGELAAGDTGHTTAHFATALDDRYADIERMHGRHGARLAAQSTAAAIDHVEALVGEFEIACDWRRVDGYLVVNDRHANQRGELLSQERDACLRVGLDVELVSGPPTPWPDGGGKALRFGRQAQCHPRRLLRGVARKLVDRGVALHEQTEVTELDRGEQVTVRTKTGPVVRCRNVVLATNTPFTTTFAMHTKQAGYQTYAIGLSVPAAALPAALWWDGLWEDDESYRYVRLMRGDAGESGGDDVLIVGGEDHKTGQGPGDADPFGTLEAWARANFAMCGPVVNRWSGDVMEPADALGYIGPEPGPGGAANVYVVTGDSGNGMTNGAIAALLLNDLIQRRDNPWATLYSPSRKIGWHGLGEHVSENVNNLRQYGDWLARGDVRSEDEIAPGTGAVIARGTRHLAVYKDDQGRCTTLSATCPHLGGVVRWNAIESTWDCPCHASRFDRTGKVIHGPANSDLRPEGAE